MYIAYATMSSEGGGVVVNTLDEQRTPWCPSLVFSWLSVVSGPSDSTDVSMSAPRENSPVQDHIMEDCSDDEEYYTYTNNNNNNNSCPPNNNNNSEYEDKNLNQSTRTHTAHANKTRPLNITVTAKVLFGSVSAISALNAERKKKPS